MRHGDLAVVPPGRGRRAGRARSSGPANPIENVVEALLVETAHAREFEPAPRPLRLRGSRRPARRRRSPSTRRRRRTSTMRSRSARRPTGTARRRRSPTFCPSSPLRRRRLIAAPSSEGSRRTRREPVAPMAPYERADDPVLAAAGDAVSSFGRPASAGGRGFRRGAIRSGARLTYGQAERRGRRRRDPRGAAHGHEALRGPSEARSCARGVLDFDPGADDPAHIPRDDRHRGLTDRAASRAHRMVEKLMIASERARRLVPRAARHAGTGCTSDPTRRRSAHLAKLEGPWVPS